MEAAHIKTVSEVTETKSKTRGKPKSSKESKKRETKKPDNPVEGMKQELVKIQVELDKVNDHRQAAKKKKLTMEQNKRDYEAGSKERIFHILDEMADEPSSKVLDAVMTQKTQVKDLSHLTLNIMAQDQVIQWCNQRENTLNRKRDSLHEKIRLHALTVGIKDVYRLQDEFIDSYKKLRASFEDLKDGINRLKGLDQNWLKHISSVDTLPELQPRPGELPFFDMLSLHGPDLLGVLERGIQFKVFENPERPTSNLPLIRPDFRKELGKSE